MLKYISLITFMFGSLAHADISICEIRENTSGVESIHDLPIGNFSSGFGAGALRLQNDEWTISITDPRWNKPVVAKLGGKPGDSISLQLIPNEKKDDYSIIECARAGLISTKRPLSANCSLIETAGSQQLQTNFKVPVGQHGHDFYEIPPAKLAPVKGWVMLYKDALMTSIRNTNTLAGLTAMGVSDKSTSLSWFPSEQNINITIKCTPEF